jgi:hypothetical protein
MKKLVLTELHSGCIPTNLRDLLRKHHYNSLRRLLVPGAGLSKRKLHQRSWQVLEGDAPFRCAYAYC